MIKPSDIKTIRRRLGITQHSLAKSADVSQSAIAKIEAGRIDPSYSTMTRLLDAIEAAQQSHVKKVANVMSHSVTMIPIDTPLADAARIMKRKGFSQLPVTDHNAIIGAISESDILDALVRGSTRLRDAITSPPPQVAPETPLPAAVELLRYVPMVLVAQHGKIIGVITKSNVLTEGFYRR